MTSKKRITHRTVFGLLLGAALGLGLASACDDKETKSPNDETTKAEDKDRSESKNLCVKYKTCNECIAGQIAGGKGEGESETECGSAALGCWTTWEKPVVCGDKKVDKKDKGDSDEPAAE